MGEGGGAAVPPVVVATAGGGIDGSRLAGAPPRTNLAAVTGGWPSGAVPAPIMVP